MKKYLHDFRFLLLIRKKVIQRNTNNTIIVDSHSICKNQNNKGLYFTFNEDSMETYEFNELIVLKKLLDLSLCDFFAETGFDPNVYFSSTFWFSLNRLNDEEWFEVTDDVIEKIGFKDKGKSNHRTNLFECLKKHFVESVDYILVLDHARTIIGRGCANKRTLKMKRDCFKKILMKVNTKNSDQIFHFLIAFEKQVLHYMRYQKECETYRRLEEKDSSPKLNIIQENMLSNVQEQNEIYIMTSTELARQFIFKVGKCINSFARL